ncbi:MAG TPA: hypothetical protein VFA04_05445 [Bryobacteraceae bacterium]|nr:hypothetical protein [Bryobacteraceae bacterium]
MSSAAQIAANQKNALASTGPCTPEGKAVSSQNALKFGLTSKQILLPWENADDFEALHAAFVAQFQPATEAEALLVDNIAIAEWRERRTEIVQNAWLAHKSRNAGENLWITAEHLASEEIVKFQKYAAAYRRERDRAWRKLENVQKERRAEAQRVAEAAAVARQMDRELQNEPKPAVRRAVVPGQRPTCLAVGEPDSATRTASDAAPPAVTARG